ncbi:hypothetical protein HAHI6034_08580 [Hathewaya histolytica]|uniref:Uncharacterized protein n=1 Tax=Hathewaya histolytica TaxID=1498 RepID=A0A4U9RU19_HATHI|nr:hypothetical protein [Hathewaya histolytica]VTQ95251.1 Uncharacterised protein [Hathewaya histolytica]
MIKSKNSLEELLKEMKSFTYYKDKDEIDVQLKEKDGVAIRCNTPGYIEINILQYDKAISFLYRDRKYINQCVSF